MRVGLLMSVYDAADYLESCLDVFHKYNQTVSNKILISVVHNCFLENHKNGEPLLSSDGTIEILNKFKSLGCIDYLFILEKPSLENEARNVALEPLLDQGVDYIWNQGSDEILKSGELSAIFNYINNDNLTAWYSINYKNYVFNDKSWVDGFCPPRIFKSKLGRLKIKGFYWDDDVEYITENGIVCSYKNLSSRVIPKNIAFVDHYTWLSNERSRKKVLYQEKHFAGGAGCSYKWNYDLNKLEFNLDYFKRTGQNIPILNHD